ncbi:glucoamylase family protein [Hymenobacter sp. GOD-10R]|uniref:glucoamylase family protein n=1 Tax=Hymenobacter sp. GOD-10R TaxID=3093922 RepID=UPI002D782A70|nr:glucoamylase family protein [Hymenobacter sp. GOD-10R]WRQ29743.1 glucoamylase family protein [Hymenobacter sp. GOD-10R]
MKHSFLFAFLFFVTITLFAQQRPAAGSSAQAKPTLTYTAPRQKNLSDEKLLDEVQRQTFKYFWDFGHPVSGMARERSNESFDYGDEVVTTGGTGFGLMAIIVAADRKWITREQAAERVLKIVNFLWKADMYHGVFPHWMDGATGKTIRFSLKDDGGDLVETSFLYEGLICARQYFTKDTPTESQLRNKILWMWENVEWNWHTQGGQNVLYWHWSPNNGWSMNHQIHGWNECLVTYVLAASSPKFAIDKKVYDQGWATGDYFKNGKKYLGTTLPLGFDYGGPLFFSHYSFLGIDPHGLKDQYADYWQQNQAHTRINYDYCVANPKKYKGYSKDSWGLTASDSYQGYAAHSPTEDLGVISPTAALSAMPYAPKESMMALKHFYNDLGDKIWGEYGFVDGFSEQHNWYAKSYLAIDQGPIVGMIENHRTGLLWKLFMSSPDVQRGLKNLGFESPHLKK